MVEFSERLKFAMSVASYDITKLAAELQISYQAVRKAVNGETKGFDAANNSKAAQLLGVSPDWLATGKGAQHVAAQTPATYGAGERVVIPMLANQLGAGQTDLMPFDEVDGGLVFKRSWLEKKSLSIPALRVLRVRGDSMSPYINDGDVVLVDTSDVRLSNGECFALRDDEHAMVKRLFKQLDGKIRVESDNPKYPPDYFTPDRPGVIMGRIVWRAG